MSAERIIVSAVIVYAIVDDALSPDFPLGVELEVFIRRDDAERFIEEVCRDEAELAAMLRIEERELDAGGLNYRPTVVLTMQGTDSVPPPYRS